MNDLIKSGKKVFTFAVVLTTIVWSIGIGALALPLTANAVTSGDLIKGTGTAVYYYGADAKRYVFPYQASYASWYTGFGTVTTMTDADLIAIPFGGNVTVRPGMLAQVVSMDSPWMVMDPKVYAVEKGGVLRWVKTADVAVAIFGATWETKIVAVPEALLTNFTIGTEINAAGDYNLATQQAVASINEDKGLTGVSGTGGLTIALASDTPAAASVPKGAANVYFTKVNFTAGATDVTITGLKVTRSGLGVDSNINAVKLFVDGVQRGTSQSLGSVHQATFSLTSNPIVVSAGTTEAVTLAADIITTVTAFDQHALGIANVADITTTATVAGTFPITGNTMSLVNTAIGTATLYNGALHPTADTGVDPAAVAFRFTQLKLSAGSTEALVIDQIIAVKNGTAANTDVKNIELYNDTAGASLGTVAALDSSGRAVFSNLGLTVAKGGYVELSVKADMNGGSGRSIAFDLHDGTSYTMMVKGATYNSGITPTRSNFCAANGTCQTQSINQGYLTVSKSASAPATGTVPVGGTGVSLMAFDFTVAGEPINVTSTIVSYTTADGTGTAATGVRQNVTNFTLMKADGTILAGPKDGALTGVGAEPLTITDGYTLPIGTTVVYAKANLSTSMTAGNTIVVSMAVTAITGKGANSGKTTYTTSTGAVVPPATAITGNTMTLQGAAIRVTTVATPVIGSMVINAQDQVFAYVDLDASSGGEDIRVSAITVTDTCVAAAGPVACTLYTGLNNLELWGDPDNTDATVVNERLTTSNSTATLAGTVAFTFQTPIVVSKLATSRLTLKADVTTVYDEASEGTADTHAFNVANTAAHITAIGKVTGNTAGKTITGAGQAQTLRASGTLKVEKAADMPSAVQIVSSSMANEVMKYKFTTQYEPVDITEMRLFCSNAAEGGVNCTLGNVAKIYVYADGVLVGNTAGYSLNASGIATVVLSSGTLVIPKDSYKTITLKIDVPEKTQVSTSTGATVQVGIESTTNVAEADLTDTLWNAGANAANDYWITANGQSSGAIILKSTINSVGTTAASQVFGSNDFSVHKGILTVSLNASSPSGTQTAGANKEVLRLNLTATGDDIIVREMELMNGGTATISGTGDLTVKSDDLGTTYATATGAQCGVYNGADGVDICLLIVAAPAVNYNALTIGVNGSGCAAAADATGSKCATEWTAADGLQVAAGTTKVIRVFGDTTGALSTKTYQMSVSNPTTNPTTDYGITYRDSSGQDVGNKSATHPATKNLPLTGGSLSY